MFDGQITASIRNVKGIVQEDGDIVRRRIRVQLEKFFSDEVAAGLGDSARVALRELKDHGMEKVVLGIGAIQASVHMLAEGVKGKQGTCIIASAVGIKAVALTHKAGGRDDEGTDATPIIRLEFEAPYTDEAWAFLGRNLKGFVGCTFEKSQLELNVVNGGTAEAAASA